jgi:GNAT superfamily N-acetyltransferase
MNKLDFAQTEQQIKACFDVMVQLIPQIENAAVFLEKVRRKQKYGYHLAYCETDGSVFAVAGLRFYEYFGIGKYLVIDDLVVCENHRGRGVGTAFFEAIASYSRAQDCVQIQLDSALDLEGAHKFYQKMGMRQTHRHFAYDIL